ncbi:hypothetical protein ACS0TY_005345 [Phlomoides rotata]
MDSSSQQIACSHDFFDRLPDEIVRLIFNQLRDAKSLCSSMSVCKRFRDIAPQVDDIFLPIPRKKSVVRESDQEIRRYSLKDLVIRALAKPFHIITQAMKSKSKGEEKDLDFYSHSIPNEILKSFGEIRALHLRLPCHENQKQSSKRSKKSTTFLKWKAEFGRELESCVILGAKSWKEKAAEDLGEESSRVMGEDELKLRIVWTISCLIAASARHYLIEETVKGLKTIENVVVSDESGQGRVCMRKEQIVEMRESKDEHRSRVPALRMKMWYLERLELTGSGKVMEGATLVVIRPAAAEVSGSDGDMVAEAFGDGNHEVGEAATKLMVAKKCYVLEMNSF